MAPKKKPEKKKADQMVVPGSDHDRHKDLDALGAEWFEIKATRMELTEQESKAKTKGLELLNKYGLDRYRCTDAATGDQFDIVREAAEEVATIKKVPKVKPVDGKGADVTVSDE